ncbi:ABC transporter ATP-binding protein [Arthrospira platensis]|uniref:Spermidine/putrescine import ATP-binding protein PotA n=1 Tax=Limnospira platensis NIES-46 TaxID=1236695 RepID=A0A5M3T160_LIMPL|nr:ABC transporter ATP-binding protein [Arthrospira platensis]AMW29128.1 spermidine/putrescine ABC transporter ATP-binding protein [Arthrospira platensis YZ]KDR55121.1 spermidine/putrescine ABC transporter ATP-binding protein [Arthrospira platensis str. Paraca]MBD2671118.1 ABC transporter ATP-binding protein [Arthrospira platensis FACHB-439]MBD2711898.1 ABC transporter ATP-binding protein [Arthrospira platensis FACHB-835]MDF2212977.1 ABC transporter ATP-binding protein [Arthrospira platensis N
MNHAVELVNVSKTFRGSKHRDFLAVNGLNLQIRDGEFFSLLGPSGCGKTTTLRMIAGFELPTTGEVYIHGQAMGQRPPFHRPVNTVFQHYALFPHLTVAQNIAFGLEMENLPSAEISDRLSQVLELVKLTEMRDRYPRQLSGGQQQRVALARSLVKQPEVLLFDEPLGALDMKLRKQMQLELKQMQQRIGITFIYVTHDQEEALTMSDRIAIMNQGEVQQVGTPIEIYEYPKTRFVADFIGDSNFLTGRVIAINNDQQTVLVDESLPIQIVAENSLSVGQIVTLVIRPEKITLYPVKSAHIPSWSGLLEERVYIGTDTRYKVKLSPNCYVMVRVQNWHRDDLQRYQPGQQVEVFVSPESIGVLES